MKQVTTLGDFIEATMDKHAHKPAYQCLGQQTTFAELERQSRQVAHWLQSKFNQGDRIAVQLPNITQYPIVAYAVLRAGMVLVNTNPMYTPREMQHQFADSGAKAIFILSAILPNLEKVIEQTEITEVVTVDPGSSSPSEGPYTNLEQLYQIDENCTLTPRTCSDSQDIALLQYTGGTTGVSKGACLTHSSVLSNESQMRQHLQEHCVEGQEIFVCPLPLYHIYAFVVNMIYMFGLGSLNILVPNPRDLNSFITHLQGIPFTGISGINTLFVGLCHHPDFSSLDFSQLKLTISGGTTLQTEVAHQWARVTGCSVTEGYGLTETSPVVSFNKPGAEDIGSIGQPLADTVIEIRDQQGKQLPQGEAGELVLKGPQLMLGYWQRPEATSEVFTEDGFLKTGDVAIEQENGNYRIVDRLKDMILVSGFNVYPNEIEAVLCTHKNVLEAAVVGGPSATTGEEVLAYVTVSGDITEQDLLAFCGENLTRYKVPKQINILEALPKSSVGKILRRELRKA